MITNTAAAIESRPSAPALTNEAARRYMARVRSHAARYARRLPKHIELQDLVSAGWAGLVDAFARCDAGRAETFEAYLDHRIRGAILDELRQHDPLTRDQRLFARRVAGVTQSLAAELGRAPTEAEIARGVGLSLEAFRGVQWRVHALSAPAHIDDEMSPVAGGEADRPDVRTEERQRRTVVRGAIEKLSPRLQDVLRMYYEEHKTLRQIADSLGVTESRVSQIHSEAIAKLRGLVTE